MTSMTTSASASSHELDALLELLDVADVALRSVDRMLADDPDLASEWRVVPRDGGEGGGVAGDAAE